MKKFYFFLIVTLFQNFSHAQVESVTPASSPMGLAFYGSDLYVTEHTNSDSHVSRIDVTQSDPQLVDYLTTGLVVPHDVAFHGTDLYISDFFDDRILKIDATNPSAALVLVLDFIDSPMGLAFHGDELFITTPNSIWKINVTDAAPIAVQVISGLQGPPKIAFRGDELYIAEPLEDKISKLNVTEAPATLVDVLIDVNQVNSLKFKGDELYYTRLYNNSIWKINIADANPLPVIVASGVASATALAFLGDELFIAEAGNNRISKISTSLSVMENPVLQDLQLFPNPAKSSVSVSGIQGEGNLSLYSISGVKLLQQPVVNNTQVNIDLPVGIYLARIECNGEFVIKKLLIK